MSTQPTVAVIGGGISGLVCAGRLSQIGINSVTVFDTGKNSVGGRCSSREITINGQAHIFDHSAQYFTVSDPRFAKIVSFLHKEGAVRIWQGQSVGIIDNTRSFSPHPQPFQAFVGAKGMKSIPEALAKLVNVRRPVWVGDVHWDLSLRKWKVGKHGYFDYLVIAHNGKCADKLMSNAGTPSVHSLLRVRFGERLITRDRRMQLCSQWVLLAAFEKTIPVTFQGAHVKNDNDISWLANNTAKLNQHSSQLQCWTIFSTRSFGTKHKVPQENIPPGKAKEVTQLLLDSFFRLIQKPKQTPCYTKVQLWGAAVPMNVLNNGEECVFDAAHQVAICGDWLVSPCIQGAAISGLAVAEKIKQHTASGGSNVTTTKMDANFVPARGEEIGSFPTNPKLLFKASTSS